MAIDSDPVNPKVGSFVIELYLTERGVFPAYGFEGMTKDAAIGYLTTVLDRLRKERETEWDTCPCCHEPWETHYAGLIGEDDDEDEEYDDEEEDEDA